MRVHLELFPPNENADVVHSGRQYDMFCDTEAIAAIPTPSPTDQKETAMKGLKRCASNLIAAREIPLPLQTESFSSRPHFVPDDRRTTPVLGQEITDSSSTFASNRCSANESRGRNLPNGYATDPSTAVSIPWLHADSSATIESRRRLFAPQTACAHKIITIDRRLTETAPMSTIQMKMTRHFGHGFSHFDGAHHGHGSSRPRSKSIMIKPSRGHDEGDHLDSSAERIYDWATWRMYHRITSARRSRASVAPVINKVPTPATAAPSKPTEDCLLNRPDGSNMEHSLASIDYSQDGEVFEIDDI